MGDNRNEKYVVRIHKIDSSKTYALYVLEGENNVRLKVGRIGSPSNAVYDHKTPIESFAANINMLFEDVTMERYRYFSTDTQVNLGGFYLDVSLVRDLLENTVIGWRFGLRLLDAEMTPISFLVDDKCYINALNKIAEV